MDLSLYINDSCIFASSVTYIGAATKVCDTASRLTTQLKQFSLEIDMDKTEVMYFYPPHPYWLNFSHMPSHIRIKNLEKDHIIKVSNSIRYLSVYFTPHLNWKLHMTTMANRTQSTIKVLGVLVNSVQGFSIQKWRTIFHTILLPTLTYGTQVWFTDKKPKGIN
jgi:hypothetical protein